MLSALALWDLAASTRDCRFILRELRRAWLASSSPRRAVSAVRSVMDALKASRASLVAVNSASASEISAAMLFAL
uniref:site-specific integrase n=1 Tax=Aeromonas salmonicida TaxID=645 RepID=UPI003899DE1B